MADAIVKKLLGLLQPDQPAPVRRAAVLVLREIAPKEKELAASLCTALDDPDGDVRMEAIAAVGRLRIERALPQLLERVKAGGPESEAAAQAAARLGARSVRALQDLMAEVAPGLRRRIAAALGSGDTATAEAAAVEALLDSDPGVVDAAARTLLEKVPSLSAAQRRAVADRILELLQPKKKAAPLATASETALVRLLASVADSQAEPVFWARVEAPQPTEVRVAALQALGKMPPPSGAAALKRLFACAADRVFAVAAPALMILKAIPVNQRTLKDWLPLLEAPDVGTRRFAIEKVGEQDTPELAAALIKQLRQPDRGLRDQALACLGKLNSGREALTAELLGAATAEDSWVLARTQAPLARDYPAALRTKVFNQACKYLELEDRRADPLLFVLRESDGRDLRDRLEERARALLKKKQYAGALRYLRLLGRDPACGEELRFLLAACGLKLSSHDVSAEGRTADPSLGQFARLIHDHEVDPLVYVKKASWLGPEDFFYLGFHFAEGTGAERPFAGEMLKLVLKHSPRSQMGKDAKSKLRSSGLD